MKRIRVKITKGFDQSGFGYVVGAIVGVTLEAARQWIAEGKAEAYDDAAKAALAEPVAPSVPQA